MWHCLSKYTKTKAREIVKKSDVNIVTSNPFFKKADFYCSVKSSLRLILVVDKYPGLLREEIQININSFLVHCDVRENKEERRKIIS